MSDHDWIEPIVGRVVADALDSHAAKLREEIVRQVMAELAAQPAIVTAPSFSAVDLARAVSEIQLGTSQKEILRALLDSGSRYAARIGLFVVKGSQATGWQSRGFASDSFKDFALDSNASAVVRVLEDRVPARVSAHEFDTHFFEQFGNPGNDQIQLLPLILKDKVAALVYADGGSDSGLLDEGSLEVLALATGSWLEVNALRKHSHKEPSGASRDAQASPGHEASAAPAFNDPFAAHAPAFAMAAAASESHSAVAVSGSTPGHQFDQEVIAGAQSAAVEIQSAAAVADAPAQTLSPGHVEPAIQPSTAPPAVSAEDQEVHRKAQRFARLLVDEIKLYNQVKVAEGRKNHDLYDRLKDTIDKSRSTYQKRYGNTVAASANYFEDEMKRSLAEDDLRVMGPNFRV